MAPIELEVLEIEGVITRPRPTYRQRAKGTLENRLKQLHITAEPPEVNEELRPRETLEMDNTGENPTATVSKNNKSRVGAALARRLLILIRSHLRKKGLK